VVVNRLLVRTDVDVFLDDDCDGRVLAKVVAGTVGVVALIVVDDSSSTQLEIGPLHCPVAVHVTKLGPSVLKPRGH
jgi:hypothetical protein